MRLGGEPESGNFEDRTGQSGGLSLGGGAGAGIFGLIFQLVASRFGIVGIIILGLGYCALTSIGGLGGGGPVGGKEGPSRLDAETRSFMVRTLGSTEETWAEIFQKSGATYTPTTMVAYSNSSQSGCGAAQAAMGPFYCPTDKKIYIDPQFFAELKQRFGAPGDFAAAYVIAHEVGHHIQDLEGTLDRARTAQARSSEVASNQVQVGVELQADCYAGVWAATARDAQGSILEPGDIEEGMRAAEAIGDDTLQKQMQGRVVPESFTHGSSAQRMEALQRGLKSGNPAACNYAR
ncbi:MAG: neutral zinc metallopeptidase [Sphingomicrobium sp.]